MTITLLGEPRSTQGCYRYTFRGGYMKPVCVALKNNYSLQARTQWKQPPLTGPLSLDITTYHGTKRKADWDNFHKLSMDALTGIVWDDDSQITDAFVHKRYDPENPRIEVIITYGKET